jgi:hypothetical protein
LETGAKENTPSAPLLLVLVEPLHIQAKNTDLRGLTFRMCREAVIDNRRNLPQG